MIRHAGNGDIPFICESFIKTVEFLKSSISDIYVNGLPDEVNDETRDLVESFVQGHMGVALVFEIDDVPVGCLIGVIEDSSFTQGNVGKVGNIAMCWVASTHRKKNVARELVSEAEKWFRHKNINTVELSYLVGNTVGQDVWNSLNYKPFRVFAYKDISSLNV